MWAYTDDEIDYLTSARHPAAANTTATAGRIPTGRPLPKLGAIRSPFKLTKLTPKWLHAWL